MHEKNLILFDYDGVIADSLQHNVGICKECCTRLGFDFLPPLDDIRNMENMTFEALGSLMGLTDDETDAFKRCVFDCLISRAEAVPVFPGIHQLLKELSQNHILAVVTVNMEEGVLRFLKKNELSEYISSVSGVNRGGSKSDQTIELMEKFAIKKDRVYLIGDAVSDILEAKKAGVKSIAVTWGFQEKERLLSEGPDFVVNSPGEVQDLFKL
jgi:phosphoglycolate phosphatase